MDLPPRNGTNCRYGEEIFLSPSNGPVYVGSSAPRLWYFCGQTKNHRSFHCGDFLFGGPEGDRTLEPHGCEKI